MTVHHMSWALKQQHVTPTQKFLLLAIADGMNGEWDSLTGTESLSRYTNIPADEIHSAAADLCALGLLIRHGAVYCLDCEPEYVAPSAPRKLAIPSALRMKVFLRDGFACLRCGELDPSNLRADHVVPESQGGEATIENLQTLCRSCNSWKGVKTIDFRSNPHE